MSLSAINSYINERIWFNSLTASYCAYPTSIGTATGTNKNIELADAGFVNYSKNNFNILQTSPLKFAGQPDSITGIPLHIGCGEVAKSFNGLTDDPNIGYLGAAGNGTVYDPFDGSLILNSTKVGEFVSEDLDIGELKLIKNINLNQVSLFQKLAYAGFNKPYLTGYVASSTANMLAINSVLVMSGDDLNSSAGTDVYVRLLSGTASQFTLNPSSNASSGQAVINLASTTGIYVGQRMTISATSYYVASITPTSITLTANLAASITTATALVFQNQRKKVTAYDALTKVLTVDNSWVNSINPDATTVYEIYKSPYNAQDYEVKWSSVSAADLASRPWCKMVVGAALKYSVYNSVDVGNADDNFDPTTQYYVRARFFKIRLRLRDVSELV